MKNKSRQKLLFKKTTIIFAMIFMIIASIFAVSYIKMGDEAAVGVFSLAATLIGTIFIAVELRNGQEVTCCDMLISQNNYFHENDKLMKVYAVLEKAYFTKDNSKEMWKDVDDTEVAFYCTFFENLYLLVHHNIAQIKDLDDLFGYRFFLFANNPYIQEHYLLPTSSSYAQIFELYSVWKAYRDEENANNKGEHHLVVGYEYCFCDNYLSNKTFMCDSGIGDRHVDTLQLKSKTFEVRKACFEDITPILELQERIMEGLADKDIFFPLSRNELIESMHLDQILVIDCEDSMAAFAVMVNNRKSERNLADDLGLPAQETVTFDAVMVAPEWRGYGLQQSLVDIFSKKALEMGASKMLCTVAPTNRFSYDNFVAKGFKPIINGANKYGGLERDILCLDLQSH